jgi:HSP20 family protein
MDDKEFTIENRLRELRKEHKLSQEELAEAIGISRQSIIALEQGRSMPSLPLAVNFCQFFNAAFEEIFNFEKEIDREFDNAINNNSINIKVINDPDESLGSRKENAMVELEPWKPFREAVSLRDAIDRLFEDSFITPAKIGGGMPKIDVKDKKDAVVVKAELPGVSEEDVNVEILDNVMTISGERKEEKEEKEEEKGYYYKESHTGHFTRSFTLPSEVIAEKASAEMKNGVLTITVPKVEPKKAQKVQISPKK